MEKRKVFSAAWCIVTIFIIVAFLLVPAHQASASSKKPIELSFASHLPPKAAPYRVAFLPWSQEIEKRSGGRLKIKFYLSQTLVKARDAYDGVKNGIADITWTAFSFNAGRFPLSSVMELPFLSPDTYTGAHVLTDLYKKFPQMRAEVDDVHLLFLWVTLPYEIHTVDKPIRTLEDIKGMKLATQPGAKAAVDGIGAVPVTMPGPQIYTTVEKGVTDGSALAWGAYKAYKIYEVTKYHANPHLGGLPYCTIVNKAKWNSLPKDLQDVITTVSDEMMPDTLCGAVTGEAEQGMKISRERGQEIYDFPPDELKRWVATGKPAWDKWVKAMEDKGKPGQAILDEAITLVEKYRDYAKKK